MIAQMKGVEKYFSRRSRRLLVSTLQKENLEHLSNFSFNIFKEEWLYCRRCENFKRLFKHLLLSVRLSELIAYADKLWFHSNVFYSLEMITCYFSIALKKMSISELKERLFEYKCQILNTV